MPSTMPSKLPKRPCPNKRLQRIGSQDLNGHLQQWKLRAFVVFWKSMAGQVWGFKHARTKNINRFDLSSHGTALLILIFA
jgi:hypothetical protein